MKNTKLAFTVLDVAVEATRKDIKYLHISVHPPTGKVIVAAPLYFRDDEIKKAVAKRLRWIRKHQRDLGSAKRETAREMVNDESHYLWGKRYLLEVVDGSVKVVGTKGKRLKITAPANSSRDELSKVLYDFYRTELRQKAAPLLADYEQKLGLQGVKVKLLQMKTRWGSYSRNTNTILLNVELAKYDQKYLEYIIAHELCHASSQKHDDRFHNDLNSLIPGSSTIAEELQLLSIPLTIRGNL